MTTCRHIGGQGRPFRCCSSTPRRSRPPAGTTLLVSCYRPLVACNRDPILRSGKPPLGNASVVYADSAARRLEHARGWLRRAAASGPVLVVSATRGAADDFVRSLLGPGEGLFGVHRTTPARLAADLAVAALARRDLAPVTGLGMEALAARASERCSQEGLQYFEPVADYPGFPRALRRTYDRAPSGRRSDRATRRAGCRRHGPAAAGRRVRR